MELGIFDVEFHMEIPAVDLISERSGGFERPKFLKQKKRQKIWRAKKCLPAQRIPTLEGGGINPGNPRNFPCFERNSSRDFTAIDLRHINTKWITTAFQRKQIAPF